MSEPWTLDSLLELAVDAEDIEVILGLIREAHDVGYQAAIDALREELTEQLRLCASNARLQAERYEPGTPGRIGFIGESRAYDWAAHLASQRG